MSKKMLVGGAIVSIISVTSTIAFTSQLNQTKEESLQRDINKLESRLAKQQLIQEESKHDEIVEINKKNINFIAYDTKFTSYSKNVSQDKLFPVKAQLNTQFKYNVTTDLSKAKIQTIQGTTYIDIAKEDIILNNIVVKQPKINYDLSFVSRFKGGSIIEIEEQLLSIAYDNIDKIIADDIINKNEIIQSNLINKLKALYDGMGTIYINIK